MDTIRLTNSQWQYDETDPLAPPGGFGEVFRGKGPNGSVAVKRLKDSPRGLDERELKIAAGFSGQQLNNIVPILDYGIDVHSEAAFVIMPICDETLQDYVQNNGPLESVEALSIISDCVAGLICGNGIVHRDLKPPNIMRHEGAWKIGDFGIAKAVQDNTSLETLRRAMSPHYASPEQWNQSRPTEKSDVYSLGCILHFMLTGKPPFVGALHELKDGHLRQDFSAIANAAPALTTLVNLLTRKSPGSRPSLPRIIGLIEKAKTQSRTKFSSQLSAVSAVIGQERSKAETERLRAQETAKIRQETARDGIQILHEMRDDLLIEIQSEAPESSLDKGSINLGQGELHIWDGNLVNVIIEGFEIVAESFYKVVWKGPPVTPGQLVVSRSHLKYEFSGTLFYGKAAGLEDYRWYEVGFFSPLTKVNGYSPFFIPTQNRQFKEAFSRVIGTCQTAFGPTPIDFEDFDAFAERVTNLFTKAAGGTLRSPSYIPIQSSYYTL